MSLVLPGKFDHIKLSWRRRFPSAFLCYSFSSEIRTLFLDFFWYFFSFLYHQQTASTLRGQNVKKILFQLFCYNKIARRAKYKNIFLKTHTDVTVISQHWYVLNYIINLITYCCKCKSFIFLSFFSPSSFSITTDTNVLMIEPMIYSSLGFPLTRYMKTKKAIDRVQTYTAEGSTCR